MDTLIKIAEFLATFGGGILVTLVAVRTRLREHDIQLKQQATDYELFKRSLNKEVAEMENRLRNSVETLQHDMEDRHEENKSALHMMERRSMFTLKLVADVARKLGVDSRVDDVVIGFLLDPETNK